MLVDFDFCSIVYLIKGVLTPSLYTNIRAINICF